MAELQDRFADIVWEALKGDHSDLRKQAIILTAYRESGLAHACGLYDDAIDMMFDGPDESDEGYAKARWREARLLCLAAQGTSASGRDPKGLEGEAPQARSEGCAPTSSPKDSNHD